MEAEPRPETSPESPDSPPPPAAPRFQLPAWARTPAASKWAFWIGFSLILLLAAGHIARLYSVTKGWIVDDAYIAFRYVDQWVAGNGLVFNPGERVEGYTCFLWVALLSLLKLFGAGVVGSARVLGIGLTLGTVGLLYVLGIRRIGPRFGWLPALLVALNHSIMAWSFGGLEVPLYLFLLVLGAFLLFVTETPWFLLAFTGAALTRPDGHLFCVLGAVFVLLVFKDRPRKQLFTIIALAAAPLFAFEAFRIAYYGAFLPNTFYVKVGVASTQLGRGLDYLLGSASAYCLFLPASLLLWLRRPSVGHFRAFLLTLGIGYSGFVIYAGGDPLPGYRFALPLLVLAWLAIATLLSDLGGRPLVGAAVIVALLVANDIAQEVRTGPIYAHFRDDKVGVCGGHIGRWFDEHAPPGAVVATNTGGSIPYFAAKQRALDMLGLTDAHIARTKRPVGTGYVGHERFDPEYVLSRKPEYILLCFSCSTAEPCLGGDKQLVKLPGFTSGYTKRKATQDGFKFFYYERNDLAPAR